MPKPALHSLHIHPVKALRAQTLPAAVVEPWGLAGDRRWAVIDDTGKVLTQREEPRLATAAAEALPGGGVVLSAPGREPLTVAPPEPGATTAVRIFGQKVELVSAGGEARDWLGEFLGREVFLAHLDDPAVRRPIDDPPYTSPGETVTLADRYPLLLTTLASLDSLNALIARGDDAVEGPLPMNRFRPSVVVSGTGPWAEDDWNRLAIGEVVLRVAKGCGRCVVTTTDQATGVRGREPLRTLAAHRRLDGKLVFGQNLVPLTTGTIRVGDPVEVLD
ncbi:MOSC domain-containing protein [Streptomyces griseoaurantiacus]|uniref:MOSC domain-containing protein n=1 Tax=Streptomyces griseoaurantiacus TaxID=68213 RepID=UPI0030E22EE5